MKKIKSNKKKSKLDKALSAIEGLDTKDLLILASCAILNTYSENISLNVHLEYANLAINNGIRYINGMKDHGQKL